MKPIKPIRIETIVQAPIDKVWEFWTKPEHIMNWNNASDDWHTPKAENDLQTGGRFSSTMAAKDGSFSFDFNGTYTDVRTNRLIAYVLEDGRNVSVEFADNGDSVAISETFDPEDQNPVEMQQGGWQAILDNFKRYVERN